VTGHTPSRSLRGSIRAKATSRLGAPPGRLVDARSGRVIALAHCLLNENVRYLGGAARPGAVDELVDAVRAAGVGICQLPCPEQQAWGGVRKCRMMLAYGSDHRRFGWILRRLVRLFLAYTRWRDRGLARRVAAELADYRRSGYRIVGVVGVDGSPSCGVRRTLDLDRAIGALAGCDPTSTDAATFNARVVLDCVVPGQGMFIEALRSELRRRRLAVPFHAHDLPGELRGQRAVDEALRAALAR
jgi:predicted secreted protein